MHALITGGMGSLLAHVPPARVTLLDRTSPDDAPCGFPEGHPPRSEVLP